MNHLLSYCGLVDAEIRASDKDLPVRKEHAAGKLVIAIEFVTLCLLAMKKVLPVDSFTKSEDLNVEIQTQFKCT